MARLICSEQHHFRLEEITLGLGAFIQEGTYWHTLLGSGAPVLNERGRKLSTVSALGSRFVLLDLLKVLLIGLSIPEVPHRC